MPKSDSQYVCQSCGASHKKWMGQCASCGAWDTLTEERAEVAPKPYRMAKGKALEIVSLKQAVKDVARLPAGMGELDRVLGGGLVPGSAVLIGGDPGIGKSTLLLQSSAALAASGQGCLYVSGEESAHQISMRAERLGVSDCGLKLAATSSVKDILATMESPDAPQVVVIDSIQTMFVDSIESAPGTVSQVRAAAHELIRTAKKRHIALLIVGHVTKEGQIAGPRVLEHMVDTVLYFEGERGHSFRILRAVKNRFGGTDEIGVFEMGQVGLREVLNPSALFLADREEHVSGSVVFAGMEGTRPLLVEIQALCAPSMMATPRRSVVGWDQNRLSMILAVLETRCGVRLSNHEVYLNVTGGFRITEPAADLAVACAILSALADDPLSPQLILFGEIGLSGEIRAVSHMEKRLKEAEKLGFTEATCPRLPKTISSSLHLHSHGNIRELAGEVKPSREEQAADETYV